jgi:hypothetical protein
MAPQWRGLGTGSGFPAPRHGTVVGRPLWGLWTGRAHRAQCLGVGKARQPRGPGAGTVRRAQVPRAGRARQLRGLGAGTVRLARSAVLRGSPLSTGGATGRRASGASPTEAVLCATTCRHPATSSNPRRSSPGFPSPAWPARQTLLAGGIAAQGGRASARGRGRRGLAEPHGRPHRTSVAASRRLHNSPRGCSMSAQPTSDQRSERSET